MRDLKPKVLFVDDEELARRTFKRIAEKEFRVVFAESVDEAINILEEDSADIGVLLSDQRMPGRLGVDLLEHCRKNYPKIIRMLTTAYSELDDAIAAVNRGEIMRYIEKPWGNIDGLLIDLRVAMSLHEMQTENDLLVAEKLSMGFKTSRLDKVRILIAVAACQESKNSLRAVELLLRELTDIDVYRELPSLEEMQGYQVFGQPLSDSISSVEIGSYLTAQKNSPDNLPAWDTLAENSGAHGLHMGQGSIDDSFPKEHLPKILLAAKSIFGENAELQVEAAVNSNGAQINIIPKQGESTVLSQWWTSRGTSSDLNTRIAALLYTYFLTFDIDGHAKLVLDHMGVIEQIELRFYGDNTSANQTGAYSSYDWIDDLMILLS